MQPLASGAKLAAYHARLLSSHDFSVFVDILTLDEVMSGTATLLDGQVNITATGPVRRTASLTLSDTDGALDFSNASAWSGTSIWVDRLVRVRHVVTVPGYGEMTAVPFIGPPTAISRNGAEVQVECADKAALATRGARAYTVRKGANAVSAIKAIMANCTGEFRFRLPSSTRRLARAYAVGPSDEAAPFVIAARIARAELDMQLLYSCDGYLMLRPRPENTVASMGYVTDVANASADFTTLSNYALVTGGAISKKVGTATVTTKASSSATVEKSSPISPERLKRNGVTRLLPIVLTESSYKTVAQTAARAKAELKTGSLVTDDLTASVVPMFHLDADDIVSVLTSEKHSRTMRLKSGSIPLGVGGDMTIGYPAWVSRVAAPRVSSHLSRKVTHPKKRRRRRRRRHR